MAHSVIHEMISTKILNFARDYLHILHFAVVLYVRGDDVGRWPICFSSVGSIILFLWLFRSGTFRFGRCVAQVNQMTQFSERAGQIIEHFNEHVITLAE